jgi:hypothetical protein
MRRVIQIDAGPVLLFVRPRDVSRADCIDIVLPGPDGTDVPAENGSAVQSPSYRAEKRRRSETKEVSASPQRAFKIS